jgi:CRISPR-associated protein (TIGR03986 family)
MSTPISKAKRFVHSNPTRKNRTARAPYNFVPLPEKIVTVDQTTLPGHERYEANTNTGWFDCKLTTRSPTYVRGMMTIKQHEKYDPVAEKNLPKEEQISRKKERDEERAPFYSAKPETEIEGRAQPMIPGSTLRGLIRSLVEIAGYGKMRWVNNVPKVTFRAVAAAREDPLSDPYKSQIGSFSRNVRAGYLKKNGEGWEIRPALKPSAEGLRAERGAYLRVKEDRIPNGAIKDFKRFNSRNYWPEYYFVSFSASTKRGRMGNYISIDQIGDEKADYPLLGTLVCTGNMAETTAGQRSNQVTNQGPDLKSPRRNHHLVLLEDEKADALKITREVLQDHQDSLSDFQRDELWKRGGLEDGAPVFYLEKRGEVTWFGHTPNFRVPALNNEGRAATPLDFIPKEIRQNEQPDLAEAIFGWVEEDLHFKLTEQSFQGLAAETVQTNVLEKLRPMKDKAFDRKKFVHELEAQIGAALTAKLKAVICKHAEKDGLEGQRAGRVFFSDASFVEERNGVWYSEIPLIPSTLGSPKITTFQHYLVQDKTQNHDPDFRQTLAHYGKLSETEIRGHKLYWHKGDNPTIEATDDQKKKEKQVTRITPVKAGVGFSFRVYFENLHGYELGALAWALQLPGDKDKSYCHKLGMGKPLGMGAVKITSSLQLTERINKDAGRYATLFAQGRFADGAKQTDVQRFIDDFEGTVLARIAPDKKRLTELDRIRMLLAMLQWHDVSSQWLEQTRYLKIEPNEYKERPVLPDPLIVSGFAPDGEKK